MRITSGKYKHKKIATSMKGVTTEYRPTAERTRLAVINLLMHSKHVVEGIINSAVVADICCGSGAFGFELISRGAAKVLFIDKDHNQVRLAKKNAEYLGEESNCRFITADGTLLPRAIDKCNIMYIDPPYRSGAPAKIVESLYKQQWFAPNHAVVIEMSAKEDFIAPEYFEVLDVREYSSTRVVLGQFKEVPQE
jgi:16S rRNA (guanine966-N2)-methyltransferase